MKKKNNKLKNLSKKKIVIKRGSNPVGKKIKEDEIENNFQNEIIYSNKKNCN